MRMNLKANKKLTIKNNKKEDPKNNKVHPPHQNNNKKTNIKIKRRKNRNHQVQAHNPKNDFINICVY
jgi:hypothetical protein